MTPVTHVPGPGATCPGASYGITPSRGPQTPACRLGRAAVTGHGLGSGKGGAVCGGFGLGRPSSPQPRTRGHRPLLRKAPWSSVPDSEVDVVTRSPRCLRGAWLQAGAVTSRRPHGGRGEAGPGATRGQATCHGETGFSAGSHPAARLSIADSSVGSPPSREHRAPEPAAPTPSLSPAEQGCRSEAAPETAGVSQSLAPSRASLRPSRHSACPARGPVVHTDRSAGCGCWLGLRDHRGQLGAGAGQTRPPLSCRPFGPRRQSRRPGRV